MSRDNIINLSSGTAPDKACDITPLQALQKCIDNIQSGEANPTNLIIVYDGDSFEDEETGEACEAAIVNVSGSDDDLYKRIGMLMWAVQAHR